MTDKLPPGKYKVYVSRVVSSEMEIEVEIEEAMSLDEIKNLAEDQAPIEDFPAPKVAYYEVQNVKDGNGVIICEFT